jgi:hypothetical protein
MIDQLQVMQALRPSGDYCIDGEITESRIATCVKYVVAVDDQDTAVFGDPGDAVTWEQFDSKRNEMQTEYEAKAYARARADAYAPIADQMDMQYWDSVNGSRTWLDHIEAVKEAHPK